MSAFTPYVKHREISATADLRAVRLKNSGISENVKEVVESDRLRADEGEKHTQKSVCCLQVEDRLSEKNLRLLEEANQSEDMKSAEKSEKFVLEKFVDTPRCEMSSQSCFDFRKTATSDISDKRTTKSEILNTPKGIVFPTRTFENSHYLPLIYSSNTQGLLRTSEKELATPENAITPPESYLENFRAMLQVYTAAVFSIGLQPQKKEEKGCKFLMKNILSEESKTVVNKEEEACRLEAIAAGLGKTEAGHRCVYCGKLYSRKYGLKIHIRTHTGYKPLKCKICSRPFGDPSNLNKHVRLHSQSSSSSTTYPCEICGKVLVRKRDLDRHLQARHVEDKSGNII